ncbi:MAG: zinc ABC transporter substrate-binding protein [Smithellaceae bacterium]
MTDRRTIPLLLLCTLVLLTLSCQSKEPPRGNDRLQVIATIFPVYDFARQVGGDKVDVTMLLPPATDAHHYELKPEDILKVSRADIFLFTNFEMEHWAYKIIDAAGESASLLAVETGQGATLLPLSDHDTHSHQGETDTDVDEHEDKEQADSASRFDPHIWLDLDNAQRMVDNITESFILKDQKNSDIYKKNAREYKQKLARLDARYRTELSVCKTRTLLHAGHWAFAYLAQKYHLSYTAAYSASAEAEPSPQVIVSMIEMIKTRKLTHIYYEDLVAPRLAQTLAKETGAQLLKLNNGHDISKADIAAGETFISAMEKNLTRLKTGMQCQ